MDKAAVYKIYILGLYMGHQPQPNFCCVNRRLYADWFILEYIWYTLCLEENFSIVMPALGCAGQRRHYVLVSIPLCVTKLVNIIF